MRIIRSPRRMTQLAAQWRRQGRTIGFVPTMGALHVGHASLIHRARRDTDRVVVSVFVNPTQFGPSEDFRRYPRPFAADVRLAHAAGADVVFAPSAVAMYPSGHATAVEVARLTAGLCGRFRPGHFRGVATVVAQLFNIVQPTTAYFGQKDVQQVVVIRRMTRDLHWPITVRVLPTVREADGLALSSRNVYLTPAQRRLALQLPQALARARRAIAVGERRAAHIERQALVFLRQGQLRPEYVACVSADELQPLRRLRGRVLIAAAVRVGSTRLIDNTVVNV